MKKSNEIQRWSDKKLIFNRNEKQLRNIILRRMELQRKYYYELYGNDISLSNESDFVEKKIFDTKMSMYYSFLELLENPKKWDSDDIEKNRNDDEIFTQQRTKNK